MKRVVERTTAKMMRMRIKKRELKVLHQGLIRVSHLMNALEREFSVFQKAQRTKTAARGVEVISVIILKAKKINLSVKNVLAERENKARRKKRVAKKENQVVKENQAKIERLFQFLREK